METSDIQLLALPERADVTLLSSYIGDVGEVVDGTISRAGAGDNLDHWATGFARRFSELLAPLAEHAVIVAPQLARYMADRFASFAQSESQQREMFMRLHLNLSAVMMREQGSLAQSAFQQMQHMHHTSLQAVTHVQAAAAGQLQQAHREIVSASATTAHLQARLEAAELQAGRVVHLEGQAQQLRAETATLQASESTLRQQLAQTTAENLTLRSQVATISGMQTQITSMECELGRLRTAAADGATAIGRVATQQEELSRMREERARSDTRLEDVKRQLTEAQGVLAARERTILEKERQTSSDLADRNTERAALEAALKKQADDVRDLQTRILKYQQSSAGAAGVQRDIEDELRRKVKGLEQRAEQAETETRRLQMELRRAEDGRRDEEHRSKELQREVGDLKQRVHTLTTAVPQQSATTQARPASVPLVVPPLSTTSAPAAAAPRSVPPAWTPASPYGPPRYGPGIPTGGVSAPTPPFSMPTSVRNPAASYKTPALTPKASGMTWRAYHDHCEWLMAEVPPHMWVAEYLRVQPSQTTTWVTDRVTRGTRNWQTFRQIWKEEHEPEDAQLGDEYRMRLLHFRPMKSDELVREVNSRYWRAIELAGGTTVWGDAVLRIMYVDMLSEGRHRVALPLKERMRDRDPTGQWTLSSLMAEAMAVCHAEQDRDRLDRRSGRGHVRMDAARVVQEQEQWPAPTHHTERKERSERKQWPAKTHQGERKERRDRGERRSNKDRRGRSNDSGHSGHSGRSRSCSSSHHRSHSSHRGKKHGSSHHPSQDKARAVRERAGATFGGDEAARKEYLQGRVKGKTVQFLVDSGATKNFVPEALGKLWNANEGHSFDVTLANGHRTRVREFAKVRVDVGRTPLGSLTFHVLPGCKEPIIGFPCLAALGAVWDLKAGRLTTSKGEFPLVPRKTSNHPAASENKTRASTAVAGDKRGNARRRQCFNCGSDGHLIAECTATPQLNACFQCGKSGHKAKDCRSKPDAKRKQQQQQQQRQQQQPKQPCQSAKGNGKKQDPRMRKGSSVSGRSAQSTCSSDTGSESSRTSCSASTCSSRSSRSTASVASAPPPGRDRRDRHPGATWRESASEGRR
jgi:hypothetical protein